MTDALLTVDEAAAFLRVSRRTVYQLIADGVLRPIKIRSCTRFTREQEWFLGHYSTPYVDWLPLEMRVKDWLKQRYRFSVEVVE